MPSEILTAEDKAEFAATEFFNEFVKTRLSKDYTAELKLQGTGASRFWKINIRPVDNPRCDILENIPADGSVPLAFISKLLWAYEAGHDRGVVKGAEKVVLKMLADKATDIFAVLGKGDFKIPMSYDIQKLATVDHLEKSIKS